ncbi:MAG: prepilin-type N-terminal cleavage/methylation domain-containing protein [Candidatus Niyogibacteria bacterium]|nr:prepilin-type N-terminal cleavage/methylation domain-containing protein [Candidatus Niyogibacteria bacterium]
MEKRTNIGEVSAKLKAKSVKIKMQNILKTKIYNLAPNSYPLKPNSGFSLLETLVALAILNAAMLGPITLAYNSIRSASLSHDKTIAAFLAEEAVELVRAKRDANIYQGSNWLDGLLGVCVAGNPCLVDATVDMSTAIRLCAGNCVVKYQYDAFTNSGFYKHQAGVDTVFSRQVVVDEVTAGKEAKITVTVSWKERFLPLESKVEIEEHIFNWH